MILASAGIPFFTRQITAITRVTIKSSTVGGFGIPFGAVCIRYGIDAYPSMVRTMFAMTEKATDYKPSSMLTGMLKDYGTGLYWLVFAGISPTSTDTSDNCKGSPKDTSTGPAPPFPPQTPALQA